MATITIYLTLEGKTLKWSPNGQSSWTDVSPKSPITGVDDGDEVDWIADETISKVKIKIENSKILQGISGNDGKLPKGQVNKKIENPISEKYNIYVKPGNSAGGYLEFDPELKYPRD